MHRILCLIALWLASCWLPATAAADTLTLTNGDRLTGAVRQLADEELRLDSELLGALAVPWSAVATLATDEPLAATLRDGSVVVGRVTLRRGTVRIRPLREPIQSVPREELESLRPPEAQLTYEEEQRRLGGATLLDFWQGSLDSGLSATRGNSDTSTFNLGFAAERQTAIDKIDTHLNFLFARDSTSVPAETTANTIRTGVRYERDARPSLFTFGFTDFEIDELQNLNLRWLLGGGFGWRLRRSDRTRFEIFGGGNLNQEFFENQAVRRSAEGLFGEELSYRLTTGIALKERLSIFPNLSDPGEYRVTLTSSLEAALNQWLSWRVALDNRFLSNPPLGTQRNDLLLTTGIRIKFGQPAPERR